MVGGPVDNHVGNGLDGGFLLLLCARFEEIELILHPVHELLDLGGSSEKLLSLILQDLEVLDGVGSLCHGSVRLEEVFHEACSLHMVESSLSRGEFLLPLLRNLGLGNWIRFILDLALIFFLIFGLSLGRVVRL